MCKYYRQTYMKTTTKKWQKKFPLCSKHAGEKSSVPSESECAALDSSAPGPTGIRELFELMDTDECLA